MPVIITAKKDKFRRCGVAHSKEPQTYKTGHWSPKQLSVLKAETMLMVQELPDEPKTTTSARAKAETMTVAELTKVLADLKVEILAGAKKADLVELYLKATESVEE